MLHLDDYFSPQVKSTYSRSILSIIDRERAISPSTSNGLCVLWSPWPGLQCLTHSCVIEFH